MIKRHTISDVAKYAGVSASTISNYLNGRYGNMSFETRRRVEDAVAALNYTPNISARRLSAKEKCGVICLIIPVDIATILGSFYYPTVLSSVGRVSAQEDYNILIYIRAGKDSAKEVEYLRSMYGTIADGFLLFDLTNDDFYFREFENMGIPYMCVGKIQGLEDYHYVATDHEKAMVDAVNHLAALGHEKIGFVREKGLSVVPRVRQQGYERAMRENGCAIDSRYIAFPQINPDEQESREAIEGLLCLDDPPTAIIAAINYAPTIERICAARGLRIPEDLSVLLLDYIDNYFILRERDYTHARNIADDVARKAFYSLLEQIGEPKKTGYSSQLLSVDLVPGKSTAPPPKSNKKEKEAVPV